MYFRNRGFLWNLEVPMVFRMVRMFRMIGYVWNLEVLMVIRMVRIIQDGIL